ncbi:MAG: hypothetical protein U0670_10610 [Anaerolineae bacterium]
MLDLFGAPPRVPVNPVKPFTPRDQEMADPTAAAPDFEGQAPASSVASPPLAAPSVQRSFDGVENPVVSSITRKTG